MCGRFSQTKPLNDLAAFFELYDQAQRPNLQPRWNIAPTQKAAVVNARNIVVTETSWSGLRTTSMASPALISPGWTTCR